MNRIFSIVLNEAGQWVVASELSQSKKKRGRALTPSLALAASLAALAPSHALAGVATIGAFNPLDNDYQAGAIVVGSGDFVTLVGNANFERGVTGTEPVALTELLANGRITSGAEFLSPGNPLSEQVTLGRTAVSYFDAATQSYRTISVNDSALYTIAELGDPSVLTVSDAKDRQYVDLRVGTVDSTGGTLDVRIGDSSRLSTAIGNAITIVPKSTSLFYADGTGALQSMVEWNAANSRVYYVGVVPPTYAGETTLTLYNRPNYKGAFTAFDGSAWMVNSYAEMVAYSDWLKTKASQGAFRTQKEYDDAFNAGVEIVTRDITFTNAITPQDEVLEPFGKVAVLHAVGANAIVKVGADSHIDALNVGSQGATANKGGVMLVEKGGAAINEGRISVSNEGSGRVSTGIHVLEGAGTNNGVINAGFLAADHEPTSDELSRLGLYVGYGAVIDGKKSTIQNNGIMNVAGNSVASSGLSQYGIALTNGASGTNDGVINVGVSTHNATAGLYGVNVGSSKFVSNGEIYIGRGPQYDHANPEAVADIQANKSSAGGRIFGVYGNGASTRIENKGEITLGSKVENSVAMFAGGGSSSINSGYVKLLGDLGAAQLSNVGMLSERLGVSTNGGIIDLLGANAVGLKASSSDGTAATVVNAGQINVFGSINPEGLRNYGVQAQGLGARANVEGGSVNLTGNGTIGMYASDGGVVTLGGGALDFVNGTNQVGFFAYGTGSAINIDSAPSDGLVVDTTDSTLFRIENGARVNNNAGAKLIVSGSGSTAMQVTGIGSKANLNGAEIVVSGDGAIAVKVEGGAVGEMTGSTKLTMKDGATAVVVDNAKYDLSGKRVADADAPSRFNNEADVEVADAKDVTAFKVLNGAELVNSGNIRLSHGIGIEILGAGSHVVPGDKQGSIQVDDGIAAIHVDQGATLTSSDEITVDGSASGIWAGADAGRVIVTQQAHITGKGSGNGNLLTNQGAAGNLKVDGATLEMAGAGAALLSQQNIDVASHGTILVTSQNGGKGIALSAVDGGVTDGSFALGTGWIIDVSGNGSGVYANTTGNVEIQSKQLAVTGPGVGILSERAGQILIGDSAVLAGTSADATMVSGKADAVINRGVLKSASADAVAVAMQGAGTFANVGGGHVTGAVMLGEGNSDVLLADASVLDGTLRTGDGDNIVVLRGNGVRFGVLEGGQNGLDTLVLEGHDYLASGDNREQLRAFERVELINGTTLSLQRDFVLDGTANATATGAGWLSIDHTSALAALETGHKVSGSVFNAGLIDLDRGIVGSTLVIAANYVGDGGVITMDTALGDDASNSDKLVVRGDTAGQSYLRVANVGGAGAHTSADGIQVVEVGGSSNGSFTLAGRVVAGAYEYLLEKGGKADPNDGSWYLRSESPEPPANPKPPVEPEAPETPIVQLPEVLDPAGPLYRPETGAYLANQAAAASMFEHTLHERLGEVDFNERQRTGGSGRSVWMRTKRNQFDGKTGMGQIGSHTDTSILQVGAELERWTDGDGRFHLGAMVGMGEADSRIGSNVIDTLAKGHVRGKSAGVYSTWYQSASKPSGAYLDAWVQYGDFDHTVHGDRLTWERYDSQTMAGSLEIGYAFELQRDESHGLYLEPQVQVVYTDYSGGDHVEANGTRVKPEQAGGMDTRLGARLYTRALEDLHNRVQPFLETNWWRNKEQNRIAFNHVGMSQSLAQDWYEVKGGAQVELGSGWSGWGEFGVQAAEHSGDHSVSGLVGIRRGW